MEKQSKKFLFWSLIFLFGTPVVVLVTYYSLHGRGAEWMLILFAVFLPLGIYQLVSYFKALGSSYSNKEGGAEFNEPSSTRLSENIQPLNSLTVRMRKFGIWTMVFSALVQIAAFYSDIFYEFFKKDFVVSAIIISPLIFIFGLATAFTTFPSKKK